MPSVKDSFPTKYMSAADLDDSTIVFTIKDVETESVGQGAQAEDKLVIYFRNEEKGFVLNKTNANTIAGLYGDDTDEWVGKQIALFPTQVDFQGRQVDAIRVKNKAPKPNRPAPGTGGRPATPITQAEADAADEDEVFDETWNSNDKK